MVNPVAATTDTGVSATGRQRLVESYDTFMTLLTAQIQNQDPLKPMDSTQFTQQLVQMTGVEQQLLTNDLLEKLVTNTGSGIQTSVSLLGREVKAEYDTAKLINGKAEWNYKLAADASEVTAEVLDDKGRVVKVLTPEDNKAGVHTLTWDGMHRNGVKMQNGGVYTIRITAKDSTGAAVTATPFVQGRVTGVEQTDGKTLITVNGVQVGWEKVTSIAEAGSADETAENDNPTPTDPDGEDETPPTEQAA
jgi:flagellar basal-body rod modification protein FlgD